MVGLFDDRPALTRTQHSDASYTKLPSWFGPWSGQTLSQDTTSMKMMSISLLEVENTEVYA